MPSQILNLSTQDIADLDAAKNNLDPIQYYTILAEAGDRYAKLALGVVQSNLPSGIVARGFAEMASAWLSSPISGADWGLISIRLMERDFTARQVAFSDLGEYRELSHEAISEYHSLVFASEPIELPPQVWTAHFPLQHADDPAALWETILQAADASPTLPGGAPDPAYLISVVNAYFAPVWTEIKTAFSGVSSAFLELVATFYDSTSHEWMYLPTGDMERVKSEGLSQLQTLIGSADVEQALEAFQWLVYMFGIPGGVVGAISNLAGNELESYQIVIDGAEFRAGSADADTIHATGSRATILGYHGDDQIFGSSGDDALYGMDGRDILDGGAGDNLIDGGNNDISADILDGFFDVIFDGDQDTALYAAETASGARAGIVITIEARESSDGEFDNLNVIDNGYAGSDRLLNIEIIDSIGARSDRLIVATLDPDDISNIEAIRLGGHLGGTRGVSGYEVYGDVVDFSLMQEGIVTLRNWTNDGLRFISSSGGALSSLNSDADLDVFGVDTIIGSDHNDRLKIANGFIYGAAGNDEISASGEGNVLYGGSGFDFIHLSGKSSLFADASSEDRIVYLNQILTGALGWGTTSDKGSIVNFAQGVAYSLNTSGELIVRGLGGQVLFIAGYEGGPDGKYQTAGLFTGRQMWEAYQLLDPNNPGRAAYIGGMVDVIGAIYAAFYGTDYINADPLVLDLDGDGLELSARSSVSPLFDIDADGFAERTGWVHGGDGFLAIDANFDGIINDVSELFGDADTAGFAELASHDLNLDGVIDASDAVFADLRVWRDDGDGVTEAGELLTLADLGIASINLPSLPGTPEIRAGNVIEATSTYSLASGETRTIADVAFNVDQVNSFFLGDSSVSAEAGVLPELKGYGEVPSLQIAASRQPGLIPIIETAAQNATAINLTSLAAAVRPMLNAWASPDYAESGEPAQQAQLPYTIYFQYGLDEQGTATLTRFVYAAQKYVNSEPVTYFVNSDGAVVPGASADGPSLGQALAFLATDAAQTGEFIGTFTASELVTLEKLTGNDIPAEDLFGDPANGMLNTYGLEAASGGERAAFGQFIEAHANLEIRAAVTFAVQTGLSAFFPDIAYDGEADLFEATTGTELKSAYMAILSAAPAGSAEAASYLGSWAPVLKVFLAQYDRGEDHLVNSYAYQFANLVRGYEALPAMELTVVSAALALGIPGVVAGQGTDDADIFYVSNGNETLNGGKGIDSYVFGSNFGDVIIDDRELVGETGAAPDNIRFADLDAADVVASRLGNDLRLDIPSTGQSVTVKDQFLRERFSAPGTRLDDDRGVVEIVFADGVVWDEIDIARAVSNPLATDETIVGTRHHDWLDGGAGNDLLMGGNSTDVYVYDIGYGNDAVHEYGPGLGTDNDIFILLEGPDFVRFGSNLTLDDLTFSRAGNSPDLVITVVSSGETLTIRDQFVATNTGPFGLQWFNRIEMFSFDSDGSIISWEDVLREVVLPTDGNDSIYGFYFEDTLEGGAGDDYLSGGDHGDTYVFRRGAANDTIEDAQANVLTAAPDRIVFAGDIAPEEVVVRRVAGTKDLELSLTDGSSVFRVIDQFNVTDTGPFGLQWFDRIESITFESDPNTVWTFEDIMARLLTEGKTPGADIIEGYYRQDILDGGAGDDLLDGAELSDTYIYDEGYGNDRIHEVDWSLQNAIDTVAFGPGIALGDLAVSRDGDDLILTIAASGETLTIVDQHLRNDSGSAQSLIEEFRFSDGSVVGADYWRTQSVLGSSGDDVITGFDYDDTLAGGAGNDRLVGGSGEDTYLFNAGDGTDTVYDAKLKVSLGDDDKVVFGVGLNAATVQLVRSGSDLAFTFSTGDVLIVEDQFKHPWLYVVERFEFADGTVWTENDIENLLLVGGATAGDDLIVGFDRDDVLTGGAGTDRLEGKSGDDIYLFNQGDGHDTIFDYRLNTTLSSIDVVRFGPELLAADVIVRKTGDDIQFAFPGGDRLTIEWGLRHEWLYTVESYEFADGTIWTMDNVRAASLLPSALDDVIEGYTTDDSLSGGPGNDTLIGLAGSDTYIYAAGEGDLVIDDRHNSSIQTDTLRIQGGLSAEDLDFVKVVDDLWISLPDGSRITVLDHFRDDASWGVEAITFDDGVTLDKAAILTRLVAPIVPTHIGTSAAETITGTGDIDIFDGNEGADTLKGGLASDTYIWRPGDGNDIIIDDRTGTDDGSVDRLRLEGVVPDDVSLTRVGNDLFVDIATSGERITIDEHFRVQWNWTGLRNAVEEISFDDGTVWDLGTIQSLAWWRGTAAAETITGTNEAETLEGRGGADALRGRLGSDTYFWRPGDGNDVISDDRSSSDDGSTDRLTLAGVAVADVTLTRTGTDLFVDVLSTGERIEIDGHFRTQSNWTGMRYAVEEIAFDDGTVWDLAEIAARSSGAQQQMVSIALEPLDSFVSYQLPSQSVASYFGAFDQWISQDDRFGHQVFSVSGDDPRFPEASTDDVLAGEPGKREEQDPSTPRGGLASQPGGRLFDIGNVPELIIDFGTGEHSLVVPAEGSGRVNWYSFDGLATRSEAFDFALARISEDDARQGDGSDTRPEDFSFDFTRLTENQPSITRAVSEGFMSRADLDDTLDDLLEAELPEPIQIPDFLIDDWMRPAIDSGHWV